MVSMDKNEKERERGFSFITWVHCRFWVGVLREFRGGVVVGDGDQVADSDVSLRQHLTPISGAPFPCRTKRHKIATKLGSRLSNFPPTLTGIGVGGGGKGG